MSFLVTGARGKVGRSVVRQLHAAGHTVRAASAGPAELTVPDGVEAVELVLDRPDTFAAALDGVRQVFLYPNPAGIDALVKAAEAAGVEHVVLLSTSAVLAPDAATHPIASHSFLVEAALTDSRLAATFLRPDAFASNTLGMADAIRNGHPIALAHPDAHLAPIHPEDIADLAVDALTGDALTGGSLTGGSLTGDSLTGRAVVLTGPESLSFREQYATVAEETGREITIDRVTRAEAEAQMGRFMPARLVGALLDLWAAAEAHGRAEIHDTTASLLGRPARTYRQWVRENAGEFRG
ncbi:NAD(P)H-binding protein [Streptomyces sp. NPDC048442]|uniref:NAD(P)H-binding protein n=1 Tax=Streptomyces sp. NPDC048442 TaxID=3154823 RepID=UPI003448C367